MEMCHFQDKYFAIASNYYKPTGKDLNFVPVYILPPLKSMYIDEPTPSRKTQEYGEFDG